MIDHLASNSNWDMNLISFAGLKGLFSFLDLLFTFSPANQLKREYHEIGIAIYKGYQTNVPLSFHQSVSTFIIMLIGID